MNRAGRPLRMAMLLALLLLAGCTSRAMTFEPDGGAYDAEDVTSAAPEVADALGEPVSEAADLRHESLVALRSASDEGALLADLLTEQFPNSDRSVPYYAEAATYDDVPVWIVFEVWGPAGGTLGHTRVWVFDRETGRIVYAAAVD